MARGKNKRRAHRGGSGGGRAAPQAAGPLSPPEPAGRLLFASPALSWLLCGELAASEGRPDSIAAKVVGVGPEEPRFVVRLVSSVPERGARGARIVATQVHLTTVKLRSLVTGKDHEIYLAEDCKVRPPSGAPSVPEPAEDGPASGEGFVSEAAEPDQQAVQVGEHVLITRWNVPQSGDAVRPLAGAAAEANARPKLLDAMAPVVLGLKPLGRNGLASFRAWQAEAG